MMVFKHEIKDLKVRGDKNHVDENVSVHGTLQEKKWKIYNPKYLNIN